MTMQKVFAPGLELLMDTSITDTGRHASEMSSMMQTNTWCFEVANIADQIVTLQMVGSFNAVGPPGTSKQVGPSVTVPANTEEIITVQGDVYWAPWIGMTAIYATGPSAGARITIRICKQEAMSPRIVIADERLLTPANGRRS